MNGVVGKLTMVSTGQFRIATNANIDVDAANDIVITTPANVDVDGARIDLN